MGKPLASCPCSINWGFVVVPDIWFWIVILKHFLVHLLNDFHSDCISPCCCVDVVRTVFIIDWFLFICRLIEGSHLIGELLLFFVYNAINHGLAETWCYRRWLIIEAIFFLLGHKWDKVCICFIGIWFFEPGFECFVEKSRCMYIVVAEANMLTVIDYLISLFWEFFSIIDMFKDVTDC